MGQRPRMVEQAVTNEEPCIKCHVDKRGPFVYEHPPVRVEGCETCHNPHGSMNAKLLRRPVVFTVCLECHNGGGTGTRGKGVACSRRGTICSIPSTRGAPPATFAFTGRTPTSIS